MTPHEPAPDSLVPGVLAGDEDAARSLFRALQPLFTRIARAHRPRSLALDDLVQMMAVRFFQKLPQWRGDAPLEHWASRLAVHTALNALAAERRRPEWSLADLPVEEADLIQRLAAGQPVRPEESSGSARELLDRLLAALPAPHRLVLTLLHLEDRSVAEISQLTGWSRPSVKVRAFRARRQLRQIYERLLKNPS